MTKIFQIGLTFYYVLFTVLGLLFVLSFCGLRLTGGTRSLIIAGWILFCFSASYFTTDLFLFFRSNIRKPIRLEEERLQRCMNDVLQRAGFPDGKQSVRLLVEENLDMNAFAIGYNSIALTRGIMDQMTDDELKGILAYELGRLKSKEGMISMAFAMTSYLPKIIEWVYRTARMQLFVLRRVSPAAMLVCLLFLGYFLYNADLLLLVLCLYPFAKLFSLVGRMFRFILMQVSRHAEYKQDHYTYQLGYGAELRQALFKLTLNGAQPANRYFIIMNNTYPVIYERIRRLERLEGLR